MTTTDPNAHEWEDNEHGIELGEWYGRWHLWVESNPPPIPDYSYAVESTEKLIALRDLINRALEDLA